MVDFAHSSAAISSGYFDVPDRCAPSAATADSSRHQSRNHHGETIGRDSVVRGSIAATECPTTLIAPVANERIPLAGRALFLGMAPKQLISGAVARFSAPCREV